MDYIKMEYPPYNLHIIKTDKFKNVLVQVYFKRKVKKDEITIRNVLADILTETTKKYPSFKKFITAKHDLYSVNISSNSIRLGDSAILSFKLDMLNEKYTEKGMFEQSLNLFKEVLFNPNIKDNKFDSKVFNVVKENIETEINSQKEDMMKYSINKMLEKMAPQKPSSFNPYGYLEDLEKINEENLYKYYTEVIKSDSVDIFVVGDIDYDEVKKNIKKYIKIKTVKKPYKEVLLEANKVRRAQKTLIPEDVMQSQLVLGLDIDSVSDFERYYVLTLYNLILGGSPESRLFKKIREENSLAYSVVSGIKIADSILFIYAGIDKKEFNKALKIVKKQISEIQKGNITNEELTRVKKEYINSIKMVEDSVDNIVSVYFLKEMLGTDTFDEKLKNIEKVTKTDIIKVAKKTRLNTIFLMYGGTDDEKN